MYWRRHLIWKKVGHSSALGRRLLHIQRISKYQLYLGLIACQAEELRLGGRQFQKVDQKNGTVVAEGSRRAAGVDFDQCLRQRDGRRQFAGLAKPLA